MALTITGRLHTKGPTELIKENFQKREFIVEITDESPSGMVFTNYAKFQLINNNCNYLDHYTPGQMIKVSFALQGKLVYKEDMVNCFTNLNVWRIEPEVAQLAAPGYAPVQYAQPAPPQPQYPNAPASSGFGNAAQHDDLPF